MKLTVVVANRVLCAQAIACLVMMIACSTLPHPEVSHPETLKKSYRASYDNVWNATLKVLDSRKYSFPTANKDAGYIETEFVQGKSEKEFYTSGGERYPKDLKWKLKLWLVRRNTRKQSGPIRVRIEKEVFASGGFLESWHKTRSDFMEEHVILYRISRTLEIDKMVDQLTTAQD